MSEEIESRQLYFFKNPSKNLMILTCLENDVIYQFPYVKNEYIDNMFEIYQLLVQKFLPDSCKMVNYSFEMKDISEFIPEESGYSFKVLKRTNICSNMILKSKVKKHTNISYYSELKSNIPSSKIKQLIILRFIHYICELNTKTFYYDKKSDSIYSLHEYIERYENTKVVFFKDFKTKESERIYDFLLSEKNKLELINIFHQVIDLLKEHKSYHLIYKRIKNVLNYLQTKSYVEEIQLSSSTENTI
jgi:hypothetical protein